MKKRMDLNRWFWKQHIIAGLITLPLMLLLAITGMIYMFKDTYEHKVYEDIRQVRPAGPRLDFETQGSIAQRGSEKPLSRLIIPEEGEATEFVIGQRADKQSVFVNAYTGEVTGEIVNKQTLMFKVRKLHGELLLGQVGTLVVELAANWMLVLLITGVYVWWPAKTWSLSGFFAIRTKQGRRILFRDLHAVGGFWISLALLVILAGGMPWTDVFGTQFKRLQKLTNTGYPATYQGRGLTSKIEGEPLSLDQMVAIAQQQHLKGVVSIGLPKTEKSVFTVSNRSQYLRDQMVIHFDQYSGEQLKVHPWRDVGLMMNLRQVFMRLHQGEYGWWNWLGLLSVVLIFSVSTLAGGISYLLRKPKGRWGLPVTPAQFKVGGVLMALIIFLGMVFPLFGASILLLWLWEQVRLRVN